LLAAVTQLASQLPQLANSIGINWQVAAVVLHV
jgi:hypothetical protein